MLRFGVGCLLAVFCCHCGTTFPETRGVTRIQIRDNGMRALGSIHDAGRVSRVMQFINARRNGWYVPWYGAPVPTLIADLYRNEEFLGHFGAGTNFFACHRDGEFYTLAASPAELKEFEQLVNAPRRPLPATK